MHKRSLLQLCVQLFMIAIIECASIKPDDVQDYVFDQRDARSISTVTSSIFRLLKMSPAENYSPKATNDLFDILRDHYPLPSGVEEPFGEYDYVIIGAGAAGCVLANRLSEDKDRSVLLIEAGGTETFFNSVPVLAGYLQHTDFNWGYRTERIAGVCMAMENQQCSWPRGRGVGGSSSINYMIYTRGNKRDWDRVAADGNHGWSYSDVLPYFLKSERANLKSFKRSPYHNLDGLMSVEDIPFRSPLVELFLEAAKQLGHKFVDYNQEDEFGFSYIQAQTLNGKRHSASMAFLHPFKKRSNLHILTSSRATKIFINKDTKTAESVEYVRDRKKYHVRARREIVLSAGTFSSAQLLMLSGVGPKQHLNEIGIEVIQDLQVGQNMYDHLGYSGSIFLINETGRSFSERRVITLQNMADWALYGEGPLSVPGGVEGIGYIKTNISEELGDYPDVEMLFIAGGITSDRSGTVRKAMKISDSFFDEAFGEIIEKPVWSIFPMLLHPKSKGYMLLKDKNPFHRPRLYYDYFSDERDLQTMIEGIKYAIRISETEAFQRIGSRHHDKPFPGCRTHSYGSDEYWECAVRQLASTLHHQIGTCKMGPSWDPEAVVDHELRVHGIKGLRVGDTSIIPRPITAHTNAPAVMIGEKLSDMIKMAHD